MAYRITALAKEQIIEHYIYGLKAFGQKQADEYVTELHDCFDLLANQPELARLREEYDPPVRVHHHGKHYVVYQIIDGASDISIVAVLREESDLARHPRGI